MEIKKIVSILAAITLSASMFTACGNNDETSSKAKTVDSQEETTTEEETTEAETEEENTEATEEETTDENSSDASTDVKPTVGFGDITISMDGSEATEEAPVKFGEWATIGTYSAQDKIYHNIAVRVTNVTTATDDQKYIDDAIALNNEYSSAYGQINVEDLKVPSDCELCIVDYEVNIPSDFPSAEWGVTSPSLSLSVGNTDGAGFPSADGASTYIGLSSTYSLDTEEDPDYQVGNTYSFKSLFIMVKGYDKIDFKISGYPEGTSDVYEGEHYEAHFASK